VSEGVESSAFIKEFYQWYPKMSFGYQGKPTKAIEDPTIDVATLIARKEKQDIPIDDGSGKLEVWSVAIGGVMTAIEPAKHGQFYGGDSYVVKYTYDKGCMIYFWLGARSTADEKGSAALKARDLDDEMSGSAVQVRITQGKEPAHFRQLFKGRLIIHAGGKAAQWSNSTEADTIDTDGVALFHVKGSSPLNTSAVQAEEKASSLNSEDCFVLVSPTKAYVWKGKNCSADEQTVATSVADILAGDFLGKGGREVVPIEEGSEPENFWNILGGKTEYAETSGGDMLPKEPRLYSCTDRLGYFQVEECTDFHQTDLLDDDVFLLDVFTSIFVWVGSKSTENEKAKALELAQKFITDAADGREADIPIVRVDAGNEPCIFTSQFAGWDAGLAESSKFVDFYEKRLAEKKAQKA
jgi:hypothetical protein